MADFDPDSVLTSPHPDSASMTVRPKLSRDDLEKLVRKYNPDITGNAVKGEVDNIQRESGGDASNDTGDHGTSGGLYQDHLSRLTGLKDFASKHGKDWTDPEIQVQYSRLEKERDYPSLLKLQQTSDDRSANEDAFKRIFERPASVLWQNNAEGRPVTESPRFNFSDWAMKEFMDRPDTDIRYMDPKEYLQLTPPLEDKPFESPSGRSLKKSVDRGDQVEQIPTLDVSVDGPTAQVTDQDGRHRALMAQQEGIQAIPVAVKGLKGNPTEIVGTDGVPQALDYPRQPRQEAPEQPKEPISLLQEAKDAVIPKAEAAEPEVPAWAREETPQSAVPAWAQEQPATTTPQKPIAQMSEEEARAANLTPDQQREWMAAQQSRFGIDNGDVAAAARGVAPIAAGAGLGLAMGGPPGAVAGAGAAGLSQLATGLSGLPGPQQATDALLNKLGVPQSTTPQQRIIENAAGGAANAFSGANAANLLVNTLKNPTSKAVALWLSQVPNRQALAGGLGGAASQLAAEHGANPWEQAAAGFFGGMAPGGINALRSLGKGLGHLASGGIGGIGTNTGSGPLKEAFRAGVEGGQKAQLFLESLRDDAPQDRIVDTAKQAVESMRKARNAEYVSGMVDIKNDASQLSFAPLRDALDKVKEAAEYGGKVTNEEAAGKLNKIDEVVKDWETGDPAVFHTPQGFDALKRRIGEIRESTTPHTEARLIVGRAYNAIKDTIVEQAPTYAKVMKDYSEASEAVGELESAFSLKEKNSIDTALRKLQSVMRNNVNTNYGYRAGLANTLNDLSGGRLNPQLAGRALSSLHPRALGGMVAGSAVVSALAGHPAALAMLPFESPRAMGEAAYYLGKLRGLLPGMTSGNGNALSTLPAAARAAALPTQPVPGNPGNALLGLGMQQ